MSHNPNSQNNQSLNDEMAANNYAADQGDDCLCQRTQPGTPVGEHIHIFCGCRLSEAFLAGCKYKTEQLSNGSVSFDKGALLQECYERGWHIQDSSVYVKGAEEQHAQLAPIINAQADQIRDLKAEIQILRQWGNKDCTAMADIEIVKFRKGEG